MAHGPLSRVLRTASLSQGLMSVDRYAEIRER